MDTETTGTEKALPEQESPRNPGRPPPIVMTSTTNLIRLQKDLKDHVEGEYEFRNTRNTELAGYSVMKFYLEKNNLQYFTFSPNYRMSSKTAARSKRGQKPLNTEAEGSTALEIVNRQLRRFSACCSELQIV
jgi:hypothetical protein